MEIYANADEAGLEISPAMREVFGNMFAIPTEEADTAFRRSVGEMAVQDAVRWIIAIRSSVAGTVYWMDERTDT